MNPEEKHRIIGGQVFCDGRWVPMENKVALERQRQKKIEAGNVYFQGEWIPIAEKLARTSPVTLPAENKPRNIVINMNDNRTTYNVDNRTIHEHEHRHVHLDRGSLEEYLHQTLPPASGNGQSIDVNEKNAPKLPAGKNHAVLGDGRKIQGLLKPPED